tara:strand:- start:2394 stop:2744 length:351 start_codon:yes stop_codon:yes gene_type:complete
MKQAKLSMYSYFQDLDLTRIADILLLVCLHDVFLRTKSIADCKDRVKEVNDLFIEFDMERIKYIANWWIEHYEEGIIWSNRQKYAKEINTVRAFTTAGNPLPLPEEYQEVEGKYWS